MTEHIHHFAAHLEWTGAAKGPVKDYASYSREWRCDIEGKPSIVGTSAAVFRGDPTLPNPEDLLVAALSSCHFLTYAALCAKHHVPLARYTDDATGKMERVGDITRFTEVVLHPKVTLAKSADDATVTKAKELHERAHHDCFIANSVSFPVRNEPTILREN